MLGNSYIEHNGGYADEASPQWVYLCVFIHYLSVTKHIFGEPLFRGTSACGC